MRGSARILSKKKGTLCVPRLDTILAVDADEVLRLHDAVHDLQLLARRVPAHVDGIEAVVDHPRARAEEVVDVLVDQHLVPRDRVGGQDDGVVRVDRDVLVCPVRHASQRGRWLPL